MEPRCHNEFVMASSTGMKTRTIVLTSTLIAAMSVAVATVAQPNRQATDEAYSKMQQERQACESDVYALCGDAIPDVERITACLKLHWKNVSRECRAIMASYGRGHNIRRGRQDK